MNAFLTFDNGEYVTVDWYDIKKRINECVEHGGWGIEFDDNSGQRHIVNLAHVTSIDRFMEATK